MVDQTFYNFKLQRFTEKLIVMGKQIGKNEGGLDRMMPSVTQEEILYVEADVSM
jgi:hypothetical protein